MAGSYTVPDPDGTQSFVNKAIVTKFDRENRVVYTFSLPGYQAPKAVAVDAQGRLFMVGTADSRGFPAVLPIPAPEPVPGGDNAFLSKLDASGTQLLFSTILGRTSLNAIAVDAGSVLIAGSTGATDFPVTANAFQRSGPYRDSFGSSSSPCSGGSTCIGQYGNTSVNAIAVARDGAIQVAGATTSDRFPVTAGAFQTQCNCDNDEPRVPYSVGFVTRFKPDLGALEWSTYFGAVVAGLLDGDRIHAMSLAIDGSVYVSGGSVSARFPITPGAYVAIHPQNGRTYPYTAKFSAAGALVFSTFLGDPIDSRGSQLALVTDADGGAWVAVEMQSARSSVTDPGSATGYLFHLSAAGMPLLELHTPGAADGRALAVDSDNRLIVASLTDGSVLRLADGSSGPAVFGLANAAWNQGSGGIAPGELVRAYGRGLGAAGLRVLFDDIPATVLSTADDGIEAFAPFVLSHKSSTSLEIVTSNGRSNAVNLPVGPADPQIFGYAGGSAAVLNEDGSSNSYRNPAEPGSVVTLYVNGAGPYSPELADGVVAWDPLPKLALPASASCTSTYVITGTQIPLYAGAAPGLIAGVSQFNVRLPPGLPFGMTWCSVTIGGVASRPRSVSVRREGS